VLIIGSQTHVLVDDGPKGSGLNNLLSIPSAIWKGLVPIEGNTHHLAAYIGMLTIVIMAAWKFAPPKAEDRAGSAAGSCGGYRRGSVL